MKKKFFLIIVLTVITGLFCGQTAQSQPLTYRDLAGKDKERVDVVIDVFARHHMVFHPDLSEIDNLYAAGGILEATIMKEGEEHNHDHPGEDEAYKDEKLASRVIKATPAADGTYHTIELDYVPGVTYTYSEIYRVKIADKLISVTRSRAEKGNPDRVQDAPDPDFMQDLAKRLSGTVTGSSIVLP